MRQGPNKPITITLTDEDIANGVQMDKENCAIANGIKRSKSSVRYVEVGASVTTVITPGVSNRYKTPEALSQCLKNWDGSSTREWTMPAGKYEFLPIPKQAMSKARERERVRYIKRKAAGMIKKPATRTINPRHIEFLQTARQGK